MAISTMGNVFLVKGI